MQMKKYLTNHREQRVLSFVSFKKWINGQNSRLVSHESLISCLVQFSCSVVSDFLRPHGLQHARPPCPSPTPRVYSNSCPLSQWCHPTNTSSVIPFSFRLQSFPASGSFQMSQFFASGSRISCYLAESHGQKSLVGYGVTNSWTPPK